VRQEQAQGIPVAALGMLAAHVGYGEAQAGLLKEAEQVPIVTFGARSSCGWPIQSDALPFDL
jgi:hypothetical protein